MKSQSVEGLCARDGGGIKSPSVLLAIGDRALHFAVTRAPVLRSPLSAGDLDEQAVYCCSVYTSAAGSPS